MNRPIYFFTGLLDCGKTRAIKNTLNDPRFTENEKTLILCFEEGDIEYEPAFLETTDSIIEYMDFKDYDSNTIKKLDEKYHPDRIFVEYNGMDDDKIFLETIPLPVGWDIAQIVCLIDASKFKLHVKNMPQFMYNHVSISDVVVINRYENAEFKFLRANLKSMNQNIYLNIEDDKGNIYDFPKTILFDENNLDISDGDFGLFYMDVVDNFLKYKDKKVKFNSFFLEVRDGNCVFGRYAMVCCANDTQKLGIQVEGLNQKLKLKAYYHIEGILRVEKKGRGYRLYVNDASVKEIDPPESEFVTFN